MLHCNSNSNGGIRVCSLGWLVARSSNWMSQINIDGSHLHSVVYFMGRIFCALFWLLCCCCCFNFFFFFVLMFAPAIKKTKIHNVFIFILLFSARVSHSRFLSLARSLARRCSLPDPVECVFIFHWDRFYSHSY